MEGEQFYFNELVDVINLKNDEFSVSEGTIVSIRGNLLIVKTGTDEEQIYRNSDNLILKQWKPGREFKKFNRVDIRSKKNKLIYEGYISQINLHKNAIIIKFTQNSEDVEQEVNLTNKDLFNTVFPPGKFSSKFNPEIHSYKEVNSFLFPNRKMFIPSADTEIIFEEKVKNKFSIYKIQGDGNCLYRSFAHQLYGDEDYFEIVKEAILDYLDLEREFFCQFIDNARYKNGFDEYLNLKRMNGVWGDDIEIQAFSEIYNKCVNIYAVGLEGIKPLKTFHEEKESLGREKNSKVCECKGSNNVEISDISGISTEDCRKCNQKVKSYNNINISYHGKAHYNSLLPIDYNEFKSKLFSEKPGLYEEKFIENLKIKKDKENISEIQSKKNIKNIKNSKNIDDSENLIKEQNDYLLNIWRENFVSHNNRISIDDLVFKLMKETNKENKVKNNENNENDENNHVDVNSSEKGSTIHNFQSNLEEKIKSNVLNETDVSYQDEMILKSILEQSRTEFDNLNFKDNNKLNENYYNHFDNNTKSYWNSEKEKTVNSSHSFYNEESSIKFVCEMGFTIEEATMALSAVGSDPDLMLQFLYSIQQY